LRRPSTRLPGCEAADPQSLPRRQTALEELDQRGTKPVIPNRINQEAAVGLQQASLQAALAIESVETLTGCPIERAYVDKGYRGHNAQNPRRVFISGQKRGVFGVIKRELRRRSASSHHRTQPKVTSAAATSKAAPATPPTSSSPPSATTSAASSPG
jgi:hypothetical protein